MNTSTTDLYPPEVRAMLDEAIRHLQTGKGNPALLSKIHEEAAQIRKEILGTHGVIDIGVPAIRELRDGDEL